jgi:hypothetical protein
MWKVFKAAATVRFWTLEILYKEAPAFLKASLKYMTIGLHRTFADTVLLAGLADGCPVF